MNIYFLFSKKKKRKKFRIHQFKNLTYFLNKQVVSKLLKEAALKLQIEPFFLVNVDELFPLFVFSLTQRVL